MEIILFLIGGSIFLWLSAEGLVHHATKAALKFKVSKTAIGLTVVAAGTSLPELFTNVVARIHDSPGAITLGSVLGSNCANIAFVLGVCALIHPIEIAKYLKQRHLPILFFSSLLFGAFLLESTLGRIDGIALIAIGLICLFLQLTKDKKATLVQIKKEEPIHLDKKHPLVHIGLMTLSLGGLLLGAYLFVEGAVKLAIYSGLSTRLISLTVIAVGTSLPEWASAIVATVRKHYEMAISLVIGSNIFNLFMITGVGAAIRPFSVNRSFLYIDWPVMLLLTGLMWLFAIRKNYGWRAGASFVVVYIAYIVGIFFLE